MLIAYKHASCHDIVCRIRDEEFKRCFIAGVQAALQFTHVRRKPRNSSIAPLLVIITPATGQFDKFAETF